MAASFGRSPIQAAAPCSASISSGRREKNSIMSDNAIVHLIDDDEDVRRALAFLLGTAGLAVKVYESALLFLEKYDGGSAGCIVSDVRMPGMDGLQLLRRLKETGVKLPVVILTGHADVALAVDAM